MRDGMWGLFCADVRAKIATARSHKKQARSSWIHAPLAGKLAPESGTHARKRHKGELPSTFCGAPTLQLHGHVLVLSDALAQQAREKTSGLACRAQTHTDTDKKTQTETQIERHDFTISPSMCAPMLPTAMPRETHTLGIKKHVFVGGGLTLQTAHNRIRADVLPLVRVVQQDKE